MRLRASPSCRVSVPTAAFRQARHAEVARDLGCQAVMGLPPNAYRTDERSLLEHFELIASAGLPGHGLQQPDRHQDRPHCRRSWPSSTTRGLHRRCQEFSGDVRRCYGSPNWPRAWTSLIGTDDTVLEVALAGARGWVAGYPQVFPQATLALYEASLAGDLRTASRSTASSTPCCAGTQDEFIQAISLART